ncbi:uncharacterized protein LOC130673523 [Microplitis mediator]|uniref:uncharacterized protein LOC130673523 n=1 Tax=Microplitis mediator TaxID=375433 RepID=UPI0025526D48|nr:uncharacterized protein LOC130673523 [Microplitis mediator]
MKWFIKILWLMYLIINNKIDIGNGLVPPYSLEIQKQMGETLESCFSDRLNTVITTADLIDVYQQASWHSINLNVIIIDDNYKSNNTLLFPNSLPSYILPANSVQKLEATLHKLKSLPSWNIASLFLIISSSDNKNCDDDASSKVLELLWEMDLLSSFYICPDQPTAGNDDTKLILIYTYNPFTNYAPYPWQEVFPLVDKPNERWTLFKQPYLKEKITCPNVTFDKTKFLNGHPITVIGNPILKSNFTSNKIYNVTSLQDKFPYGYAIFFRTLFTYLNVTPLINYEHYSLYAKNPTDGFVSVFVNTSHDLGMNKRFLSDSFDHRVDVLNSYMENGFLILTQKRSFISAFDEVFNSNNYRIIVIIFIVLFITFLIITVNNNYQYGKALIDILRLIISTSLITPLDKLSLRIIFLVSFLSVFTWVPTIQGNISASLAKPERRNVNVLRDLLELKYHVYYNPVLHSSIISLGLWSISDQNKYLHTIDYSNFDCYDKVLNDSSNACIAFSVRQLDAALKYNLYVSHNLRFKSYFEYSTRINWSLKKKIEKYAVRLKQFGILDYWDNQGLYIPLRKIKMIENIETATQYKQLAIDDLLFAFIFLAGGLFISGIAFGIEWVVNFAYSNLGTRKRLFNLRQKLVFVDGRIFVSNEYV